MSISNLLTSNTKSNQNLKIESLELNGNLILNSALVLQNGLILDNGVTIDTPLTIFQEFSGAITYEFGTTVVNGNISLMKINNFVFLRLSAASGVYGGINNTVIVSPIQYPPQFHPTFTSNLSTIEVETNGSESFATLLIDGASKSIIFYQNASRVNWANGDNVVLLGDISGVYRI